MIINLEESHGEKHFLFVERKWWCLARKSPPSRNRCRSHRAATGSERSAARSQTRASTRRASFHLIWPTLKPVSRSVWSSWTVVEPRWRSARWYRCFRAACGSSLRRRPKAKGLKYDLSFHSSGKISYEKSLLLQLYKTCLT